MASTLVTVARERAGLTRSELARRAATSRPTLSAYEHGRVSPTLETLERILDAASHRLEIVRQPAWAKVPIGRGRVASVPDELVRLGLSEALATIVLPLHIEWSSRARTIDLARRPQRLRAYEAILREGGRRDIERFIDGALLVEGWDDLVLPRALRAAWQPAIDKARARG